MNLVDKLNTFGTNEYNINNTYDSVQTITKSKNEVKLEEENQERKNATSVKLGSSKVIKQDPPFNMQKENLQDTLLSISDSEQGHLSYLAKVFNDILPEDLNLKITNLSKNKAAGAFLENTIYMDKEFIQKASEARVAEVMMHELIHAVTVKTLDSYVDLEKDGRAVEKRGIDSRSIPKPVKNLISLFNYSRSQFESNNPGLINRVIDKRNKKQSLDFSKNEDVAYGFTNIKEFLSLLSNDKFIKALDSQSFKKTDKTILNRLKEILTDLVNYIKSDLNFNEENVDVLGEAFNALFTIAETQTGKKIKSVQKEVNSVDALLKQLGIKGEGFNITIGGLNYTMVNPETNPKLYNDANELILDKEQVAKGLINYYYKNNKEEYNKRMLSSNNLQKNNITIHGKNNLFIIDDNQAVSISPNKVLTVIKPDKNSLDLYKGLSVKKPTQTSGVIQPQKPQPTTQLTLQERKEESADVLKEYSNSEIAKIARNSNNEAKDYLGNLLSKEEKNIPGGKAEQEMYEFGIIQRIFADDGSKIQRVTDYDNKVYGIPLILLSIDAKEAGLFFDGKKDFSLSEKQITEFFNSKFKPQIEPTTKVTVSKTEDLKNQIQNLNNEIKDLEQDIAFKEQDLQQLEIQKETVNPYLIILENLPKINPESARAETGLGKEIISSLLDKNGPSVEDAAGNMMIQLEKEGVTLEESEVRDEIIDILKEGKTKYKKRVGNVLSSEIKALKSEIKELNKELKQSEKQVKQLEKQVSKLEKDIPGGQLKLFAPLEIGEELENKNISTLSDKLTEFMDNLNFAVEFADDLKELSSYDAISMTDLLYKTVAVRNDSKNKGLAKEAAYIGYTFLGTKNKIRTNLIQSVENLPNYKKIYNEYAKNSNLSEYKIKELIVIDFLADAIANNFEAPKDSYINQKSEYWQIKGNFKLEKKIKYWLGRFKRFLQKVFNATPKLSTKELDDLLDDIANDILTNNFSKFGNELSPEQQLMNYENTIANDPKAKGIVESLQKMGMYLTGSLSLRKLGTIYRTKSETLHDLDFALPMSLFDAAAEKYVKNLPLAKKMLSEGVIPATLSSIAAKNNPNYDIKKSKMYEDIVSNNLRKIANNLPILDKIKEKYPTFKETAFFQGTRPGEYTIQGDIDGYQIDLFFVKEDALEKSKKGFQDWQTIFKAKLRMGRAKDIRDFSNYIPFNTNNEKIGQEKGLRHFNFGTIKNNLTTKNIVSSNKEFAPLEVSEEIKESVISGADMKQIENIINDFENTCR